ncbi:DUF6470 family protein [Paenibacillus tarimensis]
MTLPIVRAEYQLGRIGIESQKGSFEILSHQPVLEAQTMRANISAPMLIRPQLQVDQSRMWEALNGGSPVTFWNHIYSQMPEIALQGIAHIVEKGNRMGDLRIRENPIPDIALEDMTKGAPEIRIYGPASADNIDIEFIEDRPDVRIEPGTVEIQAKIRKPDIQYHRGNVRIYMEQYPEVRYHITGLDVRV